MKGSVLETPGKQLHTQASSIRLPGPAFRICISKMRTPAISPWKDPLFLDIFQKLLNVSAAACLQMGLGLDSATSGKVQCDCVFLGLVRIDTNVLRQLH